jgi:hypothetical protein
MKRLYLVKTPPNMKGNIHTTRTTRQGKMQATQLIPNQLLTEAAAARLDAGAKRSYLIPLLVSEHSIARCFGISFYKRNPPTPYSFPPVEETLA